MYKKLSVTIFIILIFVGFVFAFLYGGYFTVPEAALKSISDSKNSAKIIIDTIYVNDDPVTFFIDAQNNVSATQYFKKIILGKTGWKPGWRQSVVLKIQDISSDDVIPFKTSIKKGSNIILYGVSKSNEINLIKIDGKAPTLKPFEIDEGDYTLWYIVGTSELINAKITFRTLNQKKGQGDGSVS